MIKNFNSKIKGTFLDGTSKDLILMFTYFSVNWIFYRTFCTGSHYWC